MAEIPIQRTLLKELSFICERHASSRIKQLRPEKLQMLLIV